MPPAGLQVSPHPIIRDALPLQAGDALARHGVEVLQQMRERRARRLFHGQDLHPNVADIQMSAVAFQGGVPDEIVHVRVVLECRALRLSRHVVHQSPEESKGVSLLESGRAEVVGDLDLERSRLVIELRHCPIEITFEHLKHGARRQPVSQHSRRVAQKSPELCTRGEMWSEPPVDEIHLFRHGRRYDGHVAIGQRDRSGRTRGE